MQNRDYNYVESESSGDDVRDGVFKHAQVSLEFELKRRKVPRTTFKYIKLVHARARYYSILLGIVYKTSKRTLFRSQHSFTGTADRCFIADQVALIKVTSVAFC